MDKVQSKLLELLHELHAICEMNNLTYFIGKETALCAARWGSFPMNCRGASIYLPEADYDELERLLQSGEALPVGRAVESPLNNHSSLRMYMRYVNVNTSYISLCELRTVLFPGIGVNVYRLIGYNRSHRRKYKFKRGYEDYRYARATGAAFKASKRLYFAIRLMDMLGWYAMKKIYECTLVSTNEIVQEVYVQGYRGKRVSFNSELFKNRELIQLEDILLYAPKDINGYLSVQYGRRWATRALSFSAPGYNLIIDTDEPFDEYREAIDSIDPLIDGLVRSRADRNIAMRRRVKKRHPLDKAQRYYFRTKNRVKLEDELIPLKEEILGLYRVGKFFELASFLISYQDMCENYLRWKMPFAFDRDLYVIMTEVFGWQGLLKNAASMERMKEESFKYLDSTRSLPQDDSAIEPLYGYASYAAMKTRDRKGLSSQFTWATSEELEKLIHLRRIANNEEEPGDEESVNSSYTGRQEVYGIDSVE